MIVLLWLTGCRTTPSVGDAVRLEIQSRATRQFDRVMMAKPDEASAAAFSLAPLILFEPTATTSPVLPVEVLSWTNRVLLRGEELAQIAFAWGVNGSGSGNQTGSEIQGVRLTLNANGHPILWEVLRDSSRARVFYVTQSLEAEAMREFAAPLPGRRFWIEPANDAGQVIAGVLDEASVPMGPIVYVQAGRGDVSAVICRCMPAQAREVSGTQFYRIRDVGGARWGDLPAAVRREVRQWRPGRAPEDVTRLLRVRAGE